MSSRYLGIPEKLKGFISIDSAPLQRQYVTTAKIWLLKHMEGVYRHYPWKALLKSGTKGVATSDYGRKLLYKMMMVYDDDQERYAKLAGHNSNTDAPETVNALIQRFIDDLMLEKEVVQ